MMRPRVVARFVRACCAVAGLLAGLFPSAPAGAQQSSPPAGLAAALSAVAAPDLPALPSAEHFTTGPRSIVAGTTVTGPVAVANGAVDVTGTVIGDVVGCVDKRQFSYGDIYAAAVDYVKRRADRREYNMAAVTWNVVSEMCKK